MEKQMPKAGKRSEKSRAEEQNGEQSAATAGSSRSKKVQSLRSQGNELFKQASHDHFSPCVRRNRLDRAQQFYEEALRESQSADDKASCYKNLGAVRMSLYKIELESVLLSQLQSSSNSGGEGHLLLPKLHARNSVDFFVQALYHGTRAGKAQEWLDSLRVSLANLVDWTSSNHASPHRLRICLLRGLCQAFVDSVAKYPGACQCEAAIIAHKALAETLFQRGIRELRKDEADGETDERGRYMNCLQFVQDCHQPLSVADSLLSIIPAGNKLRQEMKELEEKVQLHEKICESGKARIEGDRLWKEALNEGKVMKVELVWDALDSYKQAALLARDRDVEKEAIATSRMGRVHAEAFKDIKRAQEYHLQATTLGLCILNICPRIVKADWYLYSNKKVDEYQEKVVIEEAKVKRAAVVLKLGGKLQALANKATESAESFLRYIYREHPHPDSTRQLGPLSTQKLVSSALKKALVHHHPDTNMKHGEEWLVLCEEITRCLIRKYENYKGID